MKQPKTVYLVFILTAIIILIVLVQIFSSSGTSKTAQDQKSSLPVDQFTSPPKLRIVSSNIPAVPVSVDTVIRLTFSKPVDNNSLDLEIIPEEETLILFSQDLTELTIKPANAWNFNTSYTIKISHSMKTQDNQFLDKDYEFTFQTKPYIGI